MQALRVRRLSDRDNQSRLYLEGKQVSRATWDAVHAGKRLDTFMSRMETRKDGSVLVREWHCIRREL